MKYKSLEQRRKEVFSVVCWQTPDVDIHMRMMVWRFFECAEDAFRQIPEESDWVLEYGGFSRLLSITVHDLPTYRAAFNVRCEEETNG